MKHTHDYEPPLDRATGSDGLLIRSHWRFSKLPVAFLRAGKAMNA